MDAEHPTGNEHNARRAALGLLAVAAIVAVAGVAFSFLPHAKTAPPVATIAPTLPPVSPNPVIGLGFSVAPDPKADEVVLFGGLDGADRTWLLFDQTWEQAHPRTSPPDRSGAVAAYDPVTKLVMLFGGTLTTGKAVNDTWGWTGGTWQRLDSGANGPPPGQGAQMAWDVANNDMVLVTNGEATNTAETWTWTDSSSGHRRWVRQPGGDLSVGVFGDVMAYNAIPNEQSMVLVTPVTPDSGASVARTWNGSSWQVATSHGPDIGAMAWYPPDDSLLACGVATYSESVSVQSDCWQWEGTQWMQQELVVPPPGSKQIIIEAEVSDSNNSRLIMFGWLIRSIPGQPQPLGVWAWDGRQWLQVA
ncbi:MAG TPA: hypothetical protein VI434_09735 [Candidatus Dormibacteraeota bacterium]